MARKIKTEKVVKRNKKKVLIIVLVMSIVAILAFVGYSMLKDKRPGNQTIVKVLSSLDEYGYTLTDQDSSYYKKEFETLESILRSSNIDEKKYAEQVAKMFVIDLYSMTTKINKYDIGGYEFFYRDKVDMFSQKVMDTLYSQLEDNTYNDRKQQLPEVKEVVVVSMDEAEYSLNDGIVVAYQVKLNISYVKDLDYDDVATIMVCKEEGVRWSVVDFQPTLEPEYD